jgi:transposase
VSRFTSKQRKYLESNKYVERVSDNNVQYTPEFKKMAIRLYNQGEPPIKIWERAGFDTSIFLRNYFRKALLRWRIKAQADGEKSLEEDKRGRPRVKKFNSVEEELAYLRAENEFLKELRALEGWFDED